MVSKFHHAAYRLVRLYRSQTYERLFIVALLSFAFLRITALFLSDMNLGPDETQYWFWSRSLEFGYFSKPPMIAWTIAFTTSIFGDHEWAARLASPILHLGTATFLFLTGRILFSAREGFWAGLIWLTLPGVFLSSMIISTDTLLLFFWSCALYFYVSLIEPDKSPKAPLWIKAVLLGVALGLGFLSKYAILYFPIGVMLCYALTGRRPPLKAILIAAVITLILITPNLIWNSQNGFQTVGHTAANAKWEGGLFNFIEFLEFFAGQFAVFGPIGFAFFVYGLSRLGKMLDADLKIEIKQRFTEHWRDILLICLAVTPLVIISVQAFISRAHANWAASAYPTATLLFAAWAYRISKSWFVKASVSLHLIIGLPFILAITYFPLIDFVGLSRVVAPLRGWEAQGSAVTSLSEDYDLLMADDRDILGGLVYYARHSNLPIAAWNSNNRIEHHYEAAHPFSNDNNPKILYITQQADGRAVAPRFETVIPLNITPHTQTPGSQQLYYFELRGLRF